MSRYRNGKVVINIFEVIGLISQRIGIIICVAVGCSLIGFFCASMIVPKYEASVNMIVNAGGNLTNVVTNDNIISSKNLVSTYAIIIKSNTVLNKVIENLELDIDCDELSENVDISAINATQVMKISVQNSDAQLAKNIILQIAQIAPDIVVDAVEAGSCKVVSEVKVGNKPVSPNRVGFMVVFAFVGTLISAMVIVFKEYLKNYIENDQDVQEYTQLPVLGVIPIVEERK